MNKDTYQLVTDRIIAKLQSGTISWKHFASLPLADPKNLVSKKPYRGINHFLLSEGKYCSEYWVTYRQAQDLGGHVRKGEKSKLVVFWKFLSVGDKDARPGETSSNHARFLSFDTIRFSMLNSAMASITPSWPNKVRVRAILSTMPKQSLPTCQTPHGW